jgi:hypothetical protein
MLWWRCCFAQSCNALQPTLRGSETSDVVVYERKSFTHLPSNSLTLPRWWRMWCSISGHQELVAQDITVDINWEFYKLAAHVTNPHLLTFFDWMNSKQVCWRSPTIAKCDFNPAFNNHYCFEKLLRYPCFNGIQVISFQLKYSGPNTEWEDFRQLLRFVLNVCASSIKVLDLYLPPYTFEGRSPISIPLLVAGFLNPPYLSSILNELQSQQEL